jgi:hypothetical protein
MGIRRVCQWNDLGTGGHIYSCEMRNPNGSSPCVLAGSVRDTWQRHSNSVGAPCGVHQPGRRTRRRWPHTSASVSHGGTGRWSPHIIHPRASVEKRAQVGRDPILAAQYRCWGLVLKCYELRTRQHKNTLLTNSLRSSKHYFLKDITIFG